MPINRHNAETYHAGKTRREDDFNAACCIGLVARAQKLFWHLDQYRTAKPRNRLGGRWEPSPSPFGKHLLYTIAEEGWRPVQASESQ